MNTVYRSKIGLEILIPIATLLVLTFCLFIANRIWLGIIVNSIMTFLIAYLCCQTKYIITDKELCVQAGFLVTRIIPIRDIKCIARTNNPISSTALSLDRIEIFYGKSRRIIISPQNRNIFVTHLRKINPNIDYLGKYQI